MKNIGKLRKWMECQKCGNNEFGFLNDAMLLTCTKCKTDHTLHFVVTVQSQ